MRKFVILLAGSMLCACATAHIESSAGKASTASTPPISTPAQSSGTSDAHFVSESQWLHAGYDMGTTVYTIYITSQDSRILRCNTQVQGKSEHGEPLNDQQTSTVFPNERTQVGNWTGLDQDAEMRYSIVCKAI